MFENLTVVIVIILILWVVGFAVYMFANRQQVDLDKEITALNAMLDEGEANETS